MLFAWFTTLVSDLSVSGRKSCRKMDVLRRVYYNTIPINLRWKQVLPGIFLEKCCQAIKQAWTPSLARRCPKIYCLRLHYPTLFERRLPPGYSCSYHRIGVPDERQPPTLFCCAFR